jgi:hypothetical protein
MSANDRVRVSIDLVKVAGNLRTPEGNSVGEAMARSFLSYAGFIPENDGTWVGPRSGLLQLNHSEILGVEWLRP